MNDLEMQEFGNLLTEKLGLNLSAFGSGAFKRSLQLFARHEGASLSDLLPLCRDKRDVFARLVKHIVVPESWFFRDRFIFDEIVRIARKRIGECCDKFRILSAPCARGEEPYSLVIALLNAGVSPQRFEVVAVDIDSEVIEQAGTACYGNYSFRTQLTEQEMIHFEYRDGGYKLNRRVVEQVKFSKHNLAECFPEYFGKFDIALCRNVLIYLTPEVQARLLNSVISSLNRNGYLFLTPAECSLCRDPRLENCVSGRTDIFRMKPESPESSESKKTILVTFEKSIRSFASAMKRDLIEISKLQSAPGAVSSSSQRASERSTTDQIKVAEELASQGEFDKSTKLLEAIVANNPYQIQAQLLLAVIHELIGESKIARDLYRRVLYLDPSNAEALAHLALLENRWGNTQKAKLLGERAKKSSLKQECNDE